MQQDVIIDRNFRTFASSLDRSALKTDDTYEPNDGIVPEARRLLETFFGPGIVTVTEDVQANGDRSLKVSLTRSNNIRGTFNMKIPNDLAMKPGIDLTLVQYIVARTCLFATMLDDNVAAAAASAAQDDFIAADMIEVDIEIHQLATLIAGNARNAQVDGVQLFADCTSDQSNVTFTVAAPNGRIVVLGLYKYSYLGIVAFLITFYVCAQWKYVIDREPPDAPFQFENILSVLQPLLIPPLRPQMRNAGVGS